MQDLKKPLETLGFTDSEIIVYLKLTKLGKASAATLANSTGINRTTVYSILKQLSIKGMVIEDIGDSTRGFMVAPPENIPHLIEEEAKSLKKKEDATKAISSALKEITKSAKYSIPKIQFVTEDRIMKFLHQRTDVWDKSIVNTKTEYLGFQETDFVKHYGKWIDWYWSRVPKEVKFRLLSNNTEDEKQMAAKQHEGRKIVFWKENIQFSSTLWVMGNYIVTIVASSSPNYLVEMYDETLASNLREVFKGILQDIEKEKVITSAA